MNWQFQHKEFTWLLIGLPVLSLLFLALLNWKKRVRKRMGDPILVKEMTAGYSRGLFILKFGLALLAMACGIIAVMDLRKPGASDATTRKGIDVVIALDVSKSMLATDIAPSRLEQARQLINNLIDAMPDNRIALVWFAGKAYLQMPLTVDHGAAKIYVASAGPDAVPQQGTVISDALNRSAMAFNSTDKRFKSVILISDGEDHDEEAVKTAKDLSGQGVMINTVGIGSPQGSLLIDPATGDSKKDENGSPVISKLNEEELKQIAAATNGIYVHLGTESDAVKPLLDQLSQIDRKAFGDISMTEFKTAYGWFAGAMLILLMLEIFIPETRFSGKERLLKPAQLKKSVS